MSARAYQRVIDALEQHGSNGRDHGAKAQYQCPAHEDRVASLTITDKPDRVLICCQADCDTLDVISKIGLGWSDLFDESATGKGWDARTLRGVGARANGDGRVTLGGVRYLPSAGDGETKTLAVKGSKRDLWPDPATIDAPTLYVVEGEPDAVSGAQLGLPTVAVPGAGKWRPEWAARLAEGRGRVVVIADCDEPGRRAAQKWAAAIAEHCADVRVLDMGPGRTDGYDLGEFAKEATTDEEREQAADMVRRAASMAPKIEIREPGPTLPGDELLSEIGAFITRFVVLPSPETADLLALWVLHSHAFEAAWATPYLRITSAAPSSGKTLLLEVLAAITRNGWHAVNPSVAVLYRKIDRSSPTLLLDEMDNYPLDDRRDALAVLNMGYKRGAMVDRCKDNGDLESFNAFCPKAYAGLDNRQLVDTLLSRSITIRLEPRLSSEPVEMWISPIAEPEAHKLRDRCEQWVAALKIDVLARHRPELPDCLHNRSAEVWWALLALAEHIGGEWPGRARAAAEGFSAGGDSADDAPDQVRLLEDVCNAFGGEPAIFTKTLLEKLNEGDESPWGARRRGEGLDARGLSQMLRPFGIKSKTVRVSGETPPTSRGYRVDQFADAFARHLPEATQATQATHPALGLEPVVSDVSDVSDIQTPDNNGRGDLSDADLEWAERPARAHVNGGPPRALLDELGSEDAVVDAIAAAFDATEEPELLTARERARAEHYRRVWPWLADERGEAS
jgi:hypothetical protein